MPNVYRSLSHFRIALLISMCLLCSLPSFAATISTTGLVANSAGTIGHGSIEPEPAPFDANNPGVQLGAHPAGGFLAGIYTLLASRDVFNTVDGTEAALGPHAPPFAGSATADLDLNSLGVTGTVYYSMRGLALDHLSASDYTFNLSTNTESRIYRGGEIEFYYDPGSGLVAFARSTDVVFEISINWNTFAITQTMLSSTADSGPSMLVLLTSSVGVSANPVQITGITSEGAPYSGAYGVFNDDGTDWGYDANPSAVATTPASLGAVKANFSSH